MSQQAERAFTQCQVIGTGSSPSNRCGMSLQCQMLRTIVGPFRMFIGAQSEENVSPSALFSSASGPGSC